VSRGNDNWLDAQARVVESRVLATDLVGKPTSNSNSPAAYSDAVVRFEWTDQQGTVRSGQIIAPEESVLFQLIEGDPIPIKFNSLNPDEFRIEGLSRDRAVSLVKRIVFAVVVFAVAILVWFGPDLLIAFSKK
jgi:hypothetical protein